MPTMLDPAEVARPESVPLLRGEDLDDPERYVTVRRVPVLDAHEDDPERGPVDLARLERIAANTNARAARGDFPALILGHTRPKRHADEIEQPPVVGYATAWHVDGYQGRPCLYCDFHYRKADHAYARSYPYRSVERLEEPEDYIDRIALLRTPPQRDLGTLRYEQDAAHIRRILYARDFPPVGEPSPDSEPEPEPVEPVDASPDAPAPTPNEEDPIMADQATAPDAAPEASAPTTVGAMAPEQFLALMTQAFHDALQQAAESDPGAPAEPEQYGADDEMLPEGEEDPMDDRETYEASEPGAGNTFVPGAIGDEDPEKRRMYEQSHRIRYEKLNREVADLRRENEIIVQELLDNRFEKRRLKYEQNLTQLEGEGYEIDRAEELELLRPDSPGDYEASAERRIRKHYKRTPVNARTSVAVAAPERAASAPGVIANRDQLNQVIDYATRNNCSVAQAKAALKIV